MAKKEYETDLHAAIYAGNLARVKELIAGGADVNAKTSDFQAHTPIMYVVVSYGVDVPTKIAIIDELIKAGADITTKGGQEMTALEIAEEVYAPKDIIKKLKYYQDEYPKQKRAKNVYTTFASNKSGPFSKLPIELIRKFPEYNTGRRAKANPQNSSSNAAGAGGQEGGRRRKTKGRKQTKRRQTKRR